MQAWSQGKSNESWKIRVRTSRGRFSISCFLMMAGAEIGCKARGRGGRGGRGVDEFKLIGGTALGFEDEN